MKVPKVNKKNALKDLVFIINTKPRASFCTVILTVWDMTVVTLSRDTNRKLTQRRRRRQENGKKAIDFDWQNNNFARASRFFVHFFAVTARLRRESA